MQTQLQRTREPRNKTKKTNKKDKEKAKMKATDLREFFFKRFGIWDFWDLFPYRWSLYYYDVIKPFFSPRNKKVRKAIPRKWADVTSLIVDVNFAMIKQFYEDEYLLGIVDWENSSEGHKQFEQWLKEAYAYVVYKRPSLEAERDNSYPPSKPINEWFESEPEIDEHGRKTYKMKDDGVPYEIKYKDVIRLEKEIEENDSRILHKMIDYREYFWT